MDTAVGVAVATTPAECPARRLPDVLKPGIHGVRAHWIRGFMAFRLVRRHTNRDADGAGVP
jgi:hypothetical protein